NDPAEFAGLYLWHKLLFTSQGSRVTDLRPATLHFRRSLKNYLENVMKGTYAYAAGIHILRKLLRVAPGHQVGSKPELGGLRHTKRTVSDSPYLTGKPHLAPDHKVLW